MRSLLIALLVAAPVFAGNLRQEYARHFLDPKAHLRLSKELVADGDRLTAFDIAEAARRGYFGDEVFNSAFREVFLGDHFDNSADAEKRIAAEVARVPGDPKKRLRLADIYISRQEWKRAEGELRKAIVLAPDNFEYVGVLSAVLQHDGREREGEQAQTAWVDKHPDAVESFRVRAQALASGESSQAAQVVDAGLAKYPDDSALHIARAEVLRGRGDIASAAKEYSKAAQLAPKWAFAQGAAARFFLKVAHDDERALSYYLDTYFLDPQYYDGEFAESRIRTLVHERARARRGTDTIAARLADDDSAVVGLAMEEAEQNWSDDFVRPLIALLHRLDPDVRYSAADLLARHARGRIGDEVVKALSDDDLLARSAAAYAVGPLAGERFVPVMVSWLSDPAELLQYDAISILITSGGNAGRAALQKLQKERTVKHALLRKMIEKALAGDH